MMIMTAVGIGDYVDYCSQDRSWWNPVNMLGCGLETLGDAIFTPIKYAAGGIPSQEQLSQWAAAMPIATPGAPQTPGEMTSGAWTPEESAAAGQQNFINAARSAANPSSNPTNWLAIIALVGAGAFVFMKVRRR